MSQILLATKDRKTDAILMNLLRTEGYRVVTATDPKGALEVLSAGGNDLAIISAGGGWDPDYSLVKLAKIKFPKMRIIAIIEGEPPQTSAKLIQLGVTNWVEKPLKLDKLLANVQKAVDFSDTALVETVNLNFQLEKVYPFKDVIADSHAMKSVCEMLSRVASTDVAILISGDKGTGKGTTADAIHLASRRKDAPMVKVNCADPDVEQRLFGAEGVKGAVEEANTGTLFLKEVWALPVAVQVRLHTLVQEHRIPAKVEGETDIPLDLRLIASTSNNLEQLVVKGQFKSDLYKVLRVISLKLPSLKDRPQDIMPIVRSVLRRTIGETNPLPILTVDVVKILEKYSWPGNIRDVQNVVSHILKSSKGEVISVNHLPPELRAEA